MPRGMKTIETTLLNNSQAMAGAGQPVTKVTIALCAHKHDLFNDEMPRIQSYLEDLPQLLDNDFRETSKKLELLAGQFYQAQLAYHHSRPGSYYLVPPDDVLKHGNAHTFGKPRPLLTKTQGPRHRLPHCSHSFN
jgi:hypothetical protein